MGTIISLQHGITLVGTLLSVASATHRSHAAPTEANGLLPTHARLASEPTFIQASVGPSPQIARANLSNGTSPHVEHAWFTMLTTSRQFVRE